MISCPWELKRSERSGTALCSILSAACGGNVGVARGVCERCIARRAWNVKGLPEVAADEPKRAADGATADAIIAESQFFRRLAVGALASKVRCGDAPWVKATQPNADMALAFARYVALEGREKARELLRAAFERQAAIPPDRGGDAPEVLAQKFIALAEAHDMVDVLEEVVFDHERTSQSLFGGAAG